MDWSIIGLTIGITLLGILNIFLILGIHVGTIRQNK